MRSIHRCTLEAEPCFDAREKLGKEHVVDERPTLRQDPSAIRLVTHCPDP